MKSANKKVPVAFQGELGAFSQQAIAQFLGTDATPVAFARFDAAFAALAAGEVKAAAIPVENALHGSVHENYDLLLKHDFEITAETTVRVILNLIAPPGLPLSKVRKVFSHPVALGQCLEFFGKNPNMEREAFYDTAGSVKMVIADRPANSAAIASELAANIYGAHILKRGIEDDPQNFTRFFLLEPKGSKVRETPVSRRKPWKTSLVFTTGNAPGALFRALAALALRDLNLVKIESRPLRGKPWEYLFYLDLLGHREDKAVRNALSHLGEVADFLRVLGTYRSA